MGAPTLIVGIGGIGGNVVQLLSERIRKEGVTDVELVALADILEVSVDFLLGRAPQ